MTISSDLTSTPATPPLENHVRVVIDGKEIAVPKGTNLIEAAKAAGVEVPFYCYHPHLSIAGNCRMCQVQVNDQPKLTIACNTVVQEGMKVATHFSSPEVKKAQEATLEFILVNHPLDCTVCDQAGHCKLQDYHYDYNAKPSRFVEEKEHKVKAIPLGPTVMLDGERCIMCTRCIRFCDEVTGTSELGMLNRGDRSVIAVNEDRPLANPLSGTVVDLCPVGALTHKKWRFNTRIWFTKQTDTICSGCSTGCNVKVAARDGEIVQVKGRLNSEVNKEWMCDEGRYGFHRFLPENRIHGGLVNGQASSIDEALLAARRAFSQSERLLVVLSPDLLLEDYLVLKRFLSRVAPNCRVVVNYIERTLSKVEAILVSPDYASNFRGAEFSGLVEGDLDFGYRTALADLEAKQFTSVVFVGDRAVTPDRFSSNVFEGLGNGIFSVAMLSSADHPLLTRSNVVLAGRSILERSGLLINRGYRLQYNEQCVRPPQDTEAEWAMIARLSRQLGAFSDDLLSRVLEGNGADREATVGILGADDRLRGLKISAIKSGGVALNHWTSPHTIVQSAHN